MKTRTYKENLRDGSLQINVTCTTSSYRVGDIMIVILTLKN